jgi:hypothetical protein
MMGIALNTALMQDDADLEIVFIPDMEKRGVRWANQQFATNAHRNDGKYIYVMDDDGKLASTKVISSLKAVPTRPAVIMVKCRRPQLKPNILPKPGVWGKRKKLRVATTNGGCFSIRADVWLEYCKNYGMKGSGDWNFLQSLKTKGDLDFYWLDLIAKETQQLGRGIRFEKCNHKTWFKDVMEKYHCEEVSPGDWRLPLYRWTDKQIAALRKELKL